MPHGGDAGRLVAHRGHAIMLRLGSWTEETGIIWLRSVSHKEASDAVHRAA